MPDGRQKLEEAYAERELLFIVALVLSIVIHSWTLANPDSPVSTETSLSDDAVLENILKEAVQQNISPDRIDRFVARKYTIAPFHILRGESIGPLSGEDDRTQALFCSKDIDCMTYWVRPIVSKKVKFIGILWMKSGGALLVYGSIPHPL